MISPTELEKKAGAMCEAVAKKMTERNVFAETLASEIEWDERNLTSNYEYSAEVFVEGPRFDVVVNAANQLVGFVDWSKWNECQWVPFQREKVVPLAMETGLVSSKALLIGFSRGPKDCLEVKLLVDPKNASSPRYVVRINPSAGRIISILPESINL